jgi:GTP cyclohydrolase IA
MKQHSTSSIFICPERKVIINEDGSIPEQTCTVDFWTKEGRCSYCGTEELGSEFIENGVVLILQGLKRSFGLNLDDVNLKDTPKRVARAYAEIFSGIKDTDSQVDEILDSKFPGEGYDEMVVCSGIKVYSMCPHHLLPVEYTVNLAYIPKESVLGISKLSRLADILARRPVLQEILTRDIGKALERLGPLGVAVTVSGIHYCMKMRGIKKEGSVITSYVFGAFREDQKTKEEFFTICALRK